MEVAGLALALLRQYTRDEISSTELQTGLRALNTGDIMTRYWDILTSDAQNSPCFEVLQLLSSLDQEMESQLRRYGESSLWDDLTELQTAIQRIEKGAPRYLRQEDFDER